MEGRDHEAQYAGEVDYRGAKMSLTAPGRWHMRIDALVSDFDRIGLKVNFDVVPQ